MSVDLDVEGVNVLRKSWLQSSAMNCGFKFGFEAEDSIGRWIPTKGVSSVGVLLILFRGFQKVGMLVTTRAEPKIKIGELES